MPAYARLIGGNETQWQVQMQTYVKSTGLFKCPSNSDQALVNPTSAGVPANYSGTYIKSNPTEGDPWDVTTLTNGDGMFGATGSPGVALSQVDSPATTISVAESLNVLLTDDPYTWSTDRLFAGHLTTSNYLFADGHMKAMRPLATIANGVNLWTRNNATPASAGLQAVLTSAANRYQ